MRVRVLVLGLLTALALGYVEPIQGYLAQRAQLERHRTRLAELTAQRTRVREEIRLINTPPVLERRARQLGMVRPGERAFVVRGAVDPPAPRPRPSSHGGPLHFLGRLL